MCQVCVKRLLAGFLSAKGKRYRLTPYLGKNGHVAVICNNVDRAVAYFKGRGIKFNEESARYNDDGSCKAIYFADEIAGFAFHLAKR